ncbi:hypothetical protein V8G54_004826 [Vigna mungo]|uniref:Glycosyltransferase n=1 Tax=Vigna mungo TaxID=3915 RepID=A0AAQ3SDC8_VIGMU
MEPPKLTHVVLVSSPGLGHLIPVIELAKRFVLLHNFKVTVIAVTSKTSPAEAQILNSLLTPSLCHLIDIPSPDINALVAQNDAVVTRLCVVMSEAKLAIRSILSEITPLPSAVIVDLFSTETIPIAREVEGQYVDQTEPIKIPGCKPVRPENVFEPMQDRNDRQYTEYLKIGKGILQSDGVLVNTWEELQREELEALREGGSLSEALNMKIPVYAVGPLVREPELETNSSTESLVTWLDQQPSQSVVYVSFGSGGTISSEQMKELAWGLELSEQRFLWVVRPPIEGIADAAFFTTGSSGIDEVAKYLPDGFVSRTREVGLLVPDWAQQVTILSHRSIGGFLSHCGWGSTLESITNGVPLIAWPLYAEQRMNAALLAEELGVAVRPRVLPTKKVVHREEIAEMVRKVIEGVESVKGNRLRERAKEVQQSSMKALSKGGSSLVSLSQVANKISG